MPARLILDSEIPGFGGGMPTARPPRESVRLIAPVCLSIALAVAALGCGSAADGPLSAPTSPSPTPAPNPPPPKLVIEGASATMSGPDADGYLKYRVRFLLRETTGFGGVTVQNVWPVSPDGIDEGYNFGPDCFHRTLQVPAGGTLDVFATDAGLSSLGCQPITWGRTAATHLDLIVTFRDEYGRYGEAKANIDLE